MHGCAGVDDGLADAIEVMPRIRRVSNVTIAYYAAQHDGGAHATYRNRMAALCALPVGGH